MKKFSAPYIFTGRSFLNSAVLICNDDHSIIDILPSNQFNPEDVIHYDGILAPGFVNTHCHLELSHLKGKLEKHTGLDEFIKGIERYRRVEEGVILEAMKTAEDEMLQNGIVAVGDISNTNLSFGIKRENKLSYHTFIEVFGFNPDKAEEAFRNGSSLLNELENDGLKGSITPHAPYSASLKLLKLISEQAYKSGNPLTIHMEENPDEDQLFIEGNGKILDRLKRFGVNTEHFKPTGFTALRSTLIHLPVCNKLQLVHNTFTQKEDIAWAEDYHKMLYWCFCPKANEYIENTTPAFSNFFRNGKRCTIGTDSLASNNSLDILSELKLINEKDLSIPLDKLFTAATLNGAEYLGIQTNYGSFEKGKRPGVILISGVELKKNKINPGAKAERLF